MATLEERNFSGYLMEPRCGRDTCRVRSKYELMTDREFEAAIKLEELVKTEAPESYKARSLIAKIAKAVERVKGK